MLDEMDDEADFDLASIPSWPSIGQRLPSRRQQHSSTRPILTSIGNAAERLARRRELKRQELDSESRRRGEAEGRAGSSLAGLLQWQWRRALPNSALDEPPLPSKSNHQELLGWSDLPALPPLPDLTPQVWPIIRRGADVGTLARLCVHVHHHGSSTAATRCARRGCCCSWARSGAGVTLRSGRGYHCTATAGPRNDAGAEQVPQRTMLPPPPQQPSLEASPADSDVAAAPPPTQPVVESPASARVAALQRGWRARRALRSTRGAELVQQLRDARQMRADLSASGEVLSGYDEVMLRGLATQVAKQVESLGLF